MMQFFKILQGDNNSTALRATGNTWTIDGDTNDLNILSVPYVTLYNPCCWYDNGRTYLSHRKSHVGGIGGRAGIIQYYNGGVTNQFMSANPAALDYHDNPVLITNGAGTIYLFHEQHTLDKSEIWVNSTPYDISTFEYQQLSPLIGDYPKLFRIASDNYFMIGRRSLFALQITSYNGTTFGTPVKATEADAETGNYRHYPFGLVNGSTTEDGCFHLKFAKRIYVTEEHYTKFYHVKIKPDDIYTWYNVNETFSKKVNTDGHLTETELDANYKYADNTVSGYGGGGHGIVNGSLIYQMNMIDGTFTLFEYNDMWTNRTNSDIQSKSTAIISSSKKYTLGKSGNDLNLYETNLDDIFTLKQKILTSNTGIYQVAIPNNFGEIPTGQKFAIFVGGFKNGNTNVVSGTEQNDIHIIEIIK